MLRQNSSTLVAMQTNARKAAEIPDLEFRMCRTSCGTLNKGVDVDIQATLGHSTLATTAIYRKPISERQQASAEELEARLRGKLVTINSKTA